jgi:glycosyltransferase involved in cell wall biosynthesis
MAGTGVIPRFAVPVGISHDGQDPALTKIAMLAPPWISVPPSGYGGIEHVVDLLCDGLVARGHEVTLYAAPGSRSTAMVQHVLPEGHEDEIGSAMIEADHVARVLDRVDDASRFKPFDVIHDHCGFTALAMANRIDVPVVHTLHGPFVPSTSQFYAQHGHKGHIVGISEAQTASAPQGMRVHAVIPNPIDVDAWPFVPVKDEYLLWVGRMHPTKGADRAIEAARRANKRIILAGPIQPGQERYFREDVQPHVDQDQVQYVGEIGGDIKRSLFAHAAALLMPIRWNEPFGMVMVEALACGTPVISFDEGAAREIVAHGTSGFLVADEEEMAAAVRMVGDIDPELCREHVKARFAVDSVAKAYEAVYAGLTNRKPAAVVPIEHAFRYPTGIAAIA